MIPADIPQSDVDVLVVGTPFVDVVLGELAQWPAPGEEVWAKHRTVTTGGVANNAVTLARLGRRTHLAGTIGTDPLGDLLVQMLSDENRLDLAMLRRADEVLTPFTLAVGDGRDRAFISQGDMPAWNPGDAPLTTRPKALFVTLKQEPVPWLQDFHSQGVMTFAGLAYDAQSDWNPAVLDALTDVDVLVCNEQEAMAYTRELSVEQALEKLAGLVRCVVVTLGAEGAVALGDLPGRAVGNTFRVHQSAVPTRALDTTGAGDSFVSALIDGSLRPGAELNECLRHAALVSSIVVAGRGGAASAPTPDLLLDRALALGPEYDFEQSWFSRDCH